MKALVQRVKRASVTIGGSKVSEIGQGILALVCVVEGDTEKDCDYLVKKCASLRIFNDEEGIMNRSLADTGGELLAVSQFTLAARTRKGNRPSYVDAARHETAVPLYERFCNESEILLGRRVGRGVFGADMLVEIENDGPVTIMVDSREGEK